MDAVVQGIVAHADRAMRQLSLEQQRDVVAELQNLLDKRARQTPARRHWEERGCDGKIRHQSREMADAARLRHANAQRLESYLCGLCGAWHLGNRR